MQTSTRQWVLAQRPNGIPDQSTFELKEIDAPPLQPDQVRVQVDYFTLDPGSRPGLTRASYVPIHPIGGVMMSAGVGTVTESNHQKFNEGDLVAGALGWQESGVFPAKGLVKLDATIFPGMLPVTTALGVLGIPGLTAYFALLKLADLKAGETVLISSASGTVGATAGQIAKIHDANPVGIAGTQQKIDWLTNEAHFDAAINYKDPDKPSSSPSTGEDRGGGEVPVPNTALTEAIANACPNGVDIYLDNVGGPTLDAAIQNMNPHGRIIISGQISEYNRAQPLGIRNTLEFINRRLTMQGFVVLDYAREFATAQTQLAQWLLTNQITIKEEIFEGIENAPAAYTQLFTGESFGRRLIHVTR